MKRADVLIIGSGIAGLTAAIQLAQNPKSEIILLSRSNDLHKSNTFWAQGGIIHRGPGDSAELLIEDILAAGAGASLRDAAHILAEEGPGLLENILIHRAHVQFDRGVDGMLDYGQEAAHSRRRILHVGDGTGKAISNGLIDLLKTYPMQPPWILSRTHIILVTHWTVTAPSPVMARMYLTVVEKLFTAHWQPARCWQRADLAVFTETPRTLRAHVEMELRWRPERARGSSTQNTSSFIQLP